MPTYQYACTECGEQLEAVQKFTDDPLTECPACQGRLRKLFNSVGIVFKGSGFYRTDSRTNGKTGSDAASGSAEKTSGSKTSESKSTEAKTTDSTKSEKASSASSTSTSSGSSSSSSGAAAKAASA